MNTSTAAALAVAAASVVVAVRVSKAAAQAALLARVAASTAAARLWRGPLRPGWSLGHETLIEFIRASYRARGVPPRPSDDPAERARQLERSLEKFAASAGDRRKGMDAFGGALPAGFREEEVLLPGGLRAVWVVPPGLPASSRRACLYLHGGGYSAGSAASHRALVARLAEASQARFLVPEYRLAPEHPHPAALDDAAAALRWMLGDAGFSPRNVAVAGDSAGGGLALSLALDAPSRGLPAPACVATLSAWTNLGAPIDTGSAVDNARYDYLVADPLYTAARAYAGAAPLSDPRVSPGLADYPGDFPPLLIQAGGAEVLLDNSLELHRRVGSSTLQVFPDMVHVFQFFPNATHGADATSKFGAFVAQHAAAAADREA